MIPIADIIISPTEPVGEDRQKVWLQKGKNMVKNFYIGSYYNVDTNKIQEGPDVVRTDYIEVKPNVDYIFSHYLGNPHGWINGFDKNYNFIQKINQDSITSSFNITNANIKFVMVSVYNNVNYLDEQWMQLEQGSTATTYEPYVEEKVFILNKNGVYEEFKKDEEAIEKSILFNTDSIQSGTMRYIKQANIVVLKITDLIFKNNNLVHGINIAHNCPLPVKDEGFLLNQFNTNNTLRVLVTTTGDLNINYDNKTITNNEWYGEIVYLVN